MTKKKAGIFITLGLAGTLMASTAMGAAITATWSGGAGNWNDGTKWNFSTPPTTASFPNNTGGDTFDVLIDNGAAGASSVTLNAIVTIASLAVSNGDSVSFSNTHDMNINTGALTNNGQINLNSSGSATDLTMVGAATISGTGELVLGGHINNRLFSTVGGSITNAAGHTIRGGGTLLGNIGTLNNQGVIRQQGGTPMIIDPGAGTNFNSNLMVAEGTAGLRIQSSDWDNTGGTMRAEAGSRFQVSAGVSIQGGTLQSVGTGIVELFNSSNSTIFDGVTIAAGSTVEQANNNDITIRNGLTNNGTWNMGSTGSLTDMIFDGSQTLGGNGTIDTGNNAGDRLLATNGVVVTHGSGHTIQGATTLLTGTGGMINQGSILATGTGITSISAGIDGFRNEGLLRASGAGGLLINGTTFEQAAGLMDIEAGSKAQVNIGSFQQTGGQTTVNGQLIVSVTSANVELAGGTLGGSGTISFTGSGSHAVNQTGGTVGPGNSPGILTIDGGDYIQGVNAAFEYELFGLGGAGVGHDLLSLTGGGGADLQGELSIIADLAFALTLNIGDQFEVLRLDSGNFLDGFFDTLTVNLAGLEFTQLFIGNSLWVEVTLANVQVGGPVPEPRQIALMLAALALMALVRRRAARIDA